MKFPEDDKHWLDVVRFVQDNFQNTDIVGALEEFSEKFTGRVVKYSTDCDCLIIHKGRMKEVDYSILDKIDSQYFPVFANEVFVIFSKANKTPSLGRDSVHLQSFYGNLKLLRKKLRNLALKNLVKNFFYPILKKYKRNLNFNLRDEEKTIKSLLQLTKDGRPNINELNLVLRDMKAISLNIKNLGYQLARDLTDKSLNMDEKLSFQSTKLRSKPTTQEDIESKWLKYWCQQLHITPIYHRKIWELCYVPQAIYSHFGVGQKLSGIGFGCGQEPLPSLFASMGWKITVTDLDPDKAKGLGWMETGQHTNAIEQAFFENIVARETFTDNVSLKYVDMNKIPEELHNLYDFCWSICALEHLGSISKGLDFIENSMKVLKSGGIAVHTTEYNYTNEPETIDDWPTVIFQDHHFKQIAKKLTEQGYKVAELSFDVGSQPLDRFIDIPPYSIGEGWLSRDTWSNVNQGVHLKLSVDGYPCTCFGLIIQK